MAKKRLTDWLDIVDESDKGRPSLAGDFAEHCERRSGAGFGNWLWRWRHGRELAELAAYYATAYETALSDQGALVGKAQKAVGSLVSMLGGTYNFPKEKAE